MNTNSVVLSIGNGDTNQVILQDLSAIPAFGKIQNTSGSVALNKITVATGATGTIIGTSGDDTITNEASGVVISMGGGSDKITNSGGSNVTFIYGGGSATIEGFKADSKLQVNSTVTGDTIGKATLASDGSIDLTIGSNVLRLKTFVGGESAFTLDALSLYNSTTENANKSSLTDFTNNKDTVSIIGGSAAETITNTAQKVTISAGGGSDSISNSGGSEAMIITGADNDTITNDANAVTINAGGGSDSISNSSGSNVVFIYTGGDDTIDGFQDDSTFSLGAENLSIVDATIDAADVSLKIGTNTVKLTGTSAIFNAGMSIFDAKGASVALSTFTIADGAKGTIHGTAANDTIDNKTTNVTIEAGAGADSINNNNKTGVTFIHGGGSDTIGGFSSSTLRIGGESTVNAATLNDNNIDLKIGDDVIKLQSVTLGGTSFSLTSPFNLYKGTEGTTSAAITNIVVENVPLGITKIIGGDSAETINNKVASITIDAGGGSNFITNIKGASGVTITTGKDNDTIDNKADNVIIAGGSGADSIFNSGASVTFQYNSGDGATTIKGFNADDSLQIMTASTSISKATLNSGSVALSCKSVALPLI